MGRYVTPAGVVIEMADKAALAVGYKPESPVASELVAPEWSAPAKRKPGRPKKSE